MIDKADCKHVASLIIEPFDHAIVRAVAVTEDAAPAFSSTYEYAVLPIIRGRTNLTIQTRLEFPNQTAKRLRRFTFTAENYNAFIHSILTPSGRVLARQNYTYKLIGGRSLGTALAAINDQSGLVWYVEEPIERSARVEIDRAFDYMYGAGAGQYEPAAGRGASAA